MSPAFKKNDAVLLKHSNELGVVAEEPVQKQGDYWYVIQFSTRKMKVVEDDLGPPPSSDADLASLAREGKWGKLQAVRCALGLERISNTNRSTIYSYQAQRILFQPYQYKPLLKVLDSPDRRLLIADEVGLGKTIEAGLILTEFQARGPMDRVLIICPSRLREKWANELNRKFDQDFQILNGQGFREAAMRCSDRPDRARLQAIVSTQTMRAENCRETLTAVLGQVDLVIIDEAHHARNPATSTSEMLRDVCEVSSAVILLTATPLQLKNEDLFTLVNALRPTEFRNSYSFESDMNHYAAIHRASSLVRTQDPAKLADISRLLVSVFSNGSTIQDPLAERVIAACENATAIATRKDWIDLERQIQDLHPLGTIVTRTKKRDVDADAPERRAQTIQCDFTAEEDEAYQRLVQGMKGRGRATRRLTLGEIQRARQAASCLPATFENSAVVTSDDDAGEVCDILPSELSDLPKANLASTVVPLGDLSWKGRDSKLAKLLELLDGVWREEPDAKVLIFAFFKGTVRYLEQQLVARGVKSLRIDGDIKSDPRNPKNDERGRRIRDFESDPTVKVMLSTEVGSEGLDFQFCHVLVNYDLPWNPMVVEQRIGRIDRFGQKSKVVQILNLVVRGTVEDEILSRLYDRIGIFERSVGITEAILGRTMTELQNSFVRGELTADEAARRVERAANVILTNQHAEEVLEKEATELFGHEDYIREEMQRVRKLGRYISEESLIAILETYFEQHHPQVRIKRGGQNTFAFRVTDDLKRDIHVANVGNSVWIDRSDAKGVLRVTTSGEAAFRDKQLELLNANHPLIRAAAKAIHKQMEQPTARIGAGRVVLNQDEDSDIDPGTYTIVLFAHEISSIRSRRILEPVAWNNDTEGLADSNVAERLLFLAVQSGKELDSALDLSPLSESGWKSINDQVFSSSKALRSSEDMENQARYVRRKRALDAEYQHKIAAKQQRLDTAKRNEQVSILPAMQGQIDKAKSEYQSRCEQLEGSRTVSARLSEPLAICVLVIERESVKHV